MRFLRKWTRRAQIQAARLGRERIFIVAKGKVFIDTNILVYSLDEQYPDKQLIARNVLRTLDQEHKAVISTQVLQEFYCAATKKLNVDAPRAQIFLKAFERFEVAVIEPQAIHTAIDISGLYQLSFWDALIVAAAAQTNCTELYTEDLNAGQVVQGIIIVNPFE